MRKLFRKGMVVAIEFLDHVEDGAEPLAFTVYGRITAVSRKYVVITAWAYTDIKIENDSNTKYYTILKSTISNWYKLEPKNEETTRENKQS